MMHGLEGDSGYFEYNSLFDRQPVKFSKDRSDVMGTFNGWDNGTGERILDMLEAIERGVRKIVKQGVTIVKFGRNKRSGEKFGRVIVKRRSYLAELTDLVVG